jgi:hypothetical protein
MRDQESEPRNLVVLRAPNPSAVEASRPATRSDYPAA